MGLVRHRMHRITGSPAHQCVMSQPESLLGFGAAIDVCRLLWQRFPVNRQGAWAICSTVNSSHRIWRPRFPIWFASFLSDSMRINAAASAIGLATGTRMPDSPILTTSVMPGERVETTGNPSAMASINASG